MSVERYFISLLSALFSLLSVNRKIKFICYCPWTSQAKKEARNKNPSTNACMGNKKPAERQTQQKRCDKRQAKLRQHSNIFNNLWPLLHAILFFIQFSSYLWLQIIHILSVINLYNPVFLWSLIMFIILSYRM